VTDDADAIDRALTRLFAHFELSDEGSLWGVVVSTLGAQERIAHRVVDRLVDAGRPVERFRFRGDALSLATRLRALPEESSGVLLVLDLDALDAEERRRVVALLNRGREALAERRWDVVLFVSPDTERAILRDAGDFWSWRRGVTDCTGILLGADFEGERERLRRRYVEAMLERTWEYKLPRALARSRRGGGPVTTEFDLCYLPPRSLPGLDDDARATAQHAPTDDVLARYARLAVSVERGLGGSQFLLWVLRREARRGRGALTPIRITCPRLLSATGDRPRGDVADVIAPLFARESLGEFAATAADAIERGEALLLINDLDDVSDPAGRARVARWVEGTVTAHPGNRVVVTASSVVWGGAAFTGRFHHVRLPPLTLADVGVLVERLTGTPAERMQHEVRDDPQLRADVRRPFNAVLYGLRGLQTRRTSRFDILGETLRLMVEVVEQALPTVRGEALCAATVRCLLSSGGALSSEALAREIGEGGGSSGVAAWMLTASTFCVELVDGTFALRPEYQDALLNGAAEGMLGVDIDPRALAHDRHRRLWSRVHPALWGGRYRHELLEAMAALKPAAYEDILLRDLELRCMTRLEPWVDVLLGAIESSWSLRVPALSMRLIARMPRNLGAGLEGRGGLDDYGIERWRHGPDDRLALDAISLLLLSTRSSILREGDLARIGAGVGSSRGAVSTRASRCVDLLAGDLDALSELASFTFGDPLARRALLLATSRSLTSRSLASTGDRAWALGLSLCRSALTAADAEVRAAALEGIACDPGAQPPDGWWDDPAPEVRATVLRAWRGRLPLVTCAALVGDASAEVREAAVGAAVEAHDESRLLAVARDPAPRVRAAAVGALKRYDTSASRAAALDALCDDEGPRAAAVEVLWGHLRRADALRAALVEHAEAGGWDPVRRALAGAALGLRYDDVIDGLRKGLLLYKGGDADTLAPVVALAATTLSEPPGDAVVRALLEHADARVREAAWGMATALREVPDGCDELVQAALADPDASVRIAAARALPGVCGGDARVCADRWCALIVDPDERVVSAAARLLREAGASPSWAGEPRRRTCDELATRLRDRAFVDARGEETVALLWETLNDLAAAQSDEADAG